MFFLLFLLDDRRIQIRILDVIKVGMGISSNKHHLGVVGFERQNWKIGRLVTWMFW
jgi:hypothetical protein